MALRVIGGKLPFIVASTAQFTTSAGLTTGHTFNSIVLGPEHPSRLVVAHCWALNGISAVSDISDVSIDGTSGSVADDRGPTGNAFTLRCAGRLAYRPLPTGASISCAISMSTQNNHFYGCHLFSVYHLRSFTPSASDGLATGNSGNPNFLDVDLSLSSKGVYIVGGCCGGNGLLTTNLGNADQHNNRSAPPQAQGFHGWGIEQPVGSQNLFYGPGSAMIGVINGASFR